MSTRRIRQFLGMSTVAAVLLGIAAATPVTAAPATTAPRGPVMDPPVVISQVYGGGGNSGATYTHDFIELLNRSDAPVDLTGWSVQYASAAGTSWQVTPLSGTVPPGRYYLVAQAAGAGGSRPLPTPDAVGSIPMSASSGKVALVADTTRLTGSCPLGQVVDFVGFGTANCYEGTGPTATLSNPVAALRHDAGCRDTDDNAADFDTGAPTPRNSAAPPAPCGASPGPADPTVTCPTGMRTVETYATEGLVTASVPEGEITEIQISGVTPAPAAGELVLTDLATGPAASATLRVPAELRLVTPTDASEVTPLSVEVTAVTDTGRTASCVATVNVIPLVPLGVVQGVVTDDATNFTSPLLGAEVAVRGVVTQVTMEGNGNRGFFLQNRPEYADGDARSSDGIFVFNSSFTTLRTDFDGPAADEFGANYPVAVGDELVLRGTVGQYFGMTQLAGASTFVWERTATGLDVTEAVAVPEVDPPADAADATRYFRRHLGMQLAVPAGSLVVSGRDVFSGTDAEVWAIRGDHPVAQRDEAYARRVFRDVHPLDNLPDTGFDDGNGYRFVLGSFGVKGTYDDPTAVLAPARTFDSITEANRGGVYLSFGKYTINVVDQLTLANGPEPAANAPVPAPDRAREFTVAGYNVENLYDFRDSPDSGCDFPGNPGCFADGDSVTPPYDYVPADDAEYQDRLARMAAQIRLDLHAPDILLVQETEAQDVCRVNPAWTPETGAELGAARLDCDLENPGADNQRADGAPDSLQELALVIAEQGGPIYQAAFDPDAADLRGITTAYLYRVDRVELLPADPADPVLGSDPAVVYPGQPLPFNADVSNPKALNASLPEEVAVRCTSSGPTSCDGANVFTRAAQVALFRVWRGEPGVSSWADLYLVNNHFSSGPENRVLQRTEQAAYNAAIAAALLAADPDARVLVGGDLNTFPRPDDPYSPGAPIDGVGEGPSDQLRPLYEAGLVNLFDDLLARSPAAAYSYGFQGQAQTLDHLWVSPGWYPQLRGAYSAKINVDYPADAVGETPAYGRYGVSDHDSMVARFDAATSFASVQRLLDHLVATGQLPPTSAIPVRALLTTAERLSARGNDRAAAAVLASLETVLETFGRVGMIAERVADGLVAEVRQLRSGSGVRS
ncbi:MAG TPA: lamin tail domain-containing protein [Natronosporangium sp.]|nr:lamin tail domain-containing protein [Natronosporangium sp.]